MWREITSEISYHKWKVLWLVGFWSIFVFPQLLAGVKFTRFFFMGSVAINFLFFSFVFFQREKEKSDRQHIQFPLSLLFHSLARILTLLIPQAINLIVSLSLLFIFTFAVLSKMLCPILITNGVIMTAVIATSTTNDLVKNNNPFLVAVYWTVFGIALLLPFYDFLSGFFLVLAGSRSPGDLPDVSAFIAGLPGALYFNAFALVLFIINVFIFSHRKSYLK